MTDMAIEDSSGARKGGVRDMGNPVPYISAHVALGVVAGTVIVMFLGLGAVIWQSSTHYGAGIEIIRIAASNGADPNAMARRVFLLASGQQITTFKAAAFGVSMILALIGGVFVLNGASAAYRLSFDRPEGSSGLRTALETTSPGLVIITLSMMLAAFTVHSKSTLQDHQDWDLGTGKSTAERIKPERFEAVADELMSSSDKAELSNTTTPEAFEDVARDLEKTTPAAAGSNSNTTVPKKRGADE